TGTTAIAAKRLGRQFIGFDIDEKYVEITKQKLEQEHTLSKLGNCWVSFYLDEVVTIRDKDWDYLKDFYLIPTNPIDIDTTPIMLKSKVNIQTPKGLLNTNGNNHHNFENQNSLF
ncbi:MAG TPA: DNA methyltransferase, partial [Bacteroidota bacterium]|nr:DNA methyltransferase [Bacteroidota bacterium]